MKSKRLKGVTCKPEGSGNLLALVLLDVIVIELDRDERLLRAEEGREDERLSGTHTQARHVKILMDTHTHTHISQLFFFPWRLIEARKCQFANEWSDCFEVWEMEMRRNETDLWANYRSKEINRPTVIVFVTDLFCWDYSRRSTDALKRNPPNKSFHVSAHWMLG